MTNRSRRLLGVFVLLLGLLIYIAVVITIGTNWLPAHWAVQLVFYGLAGVLWAIPLRPFMAWMNSGSDE